jgi:hypothetical protein
MCSAEDVGDDYSRGDVVEHCRTAHSGRNTSFCSCLYLFFKRSLVRRGHFGWPTGNIGAALAILNNGRWVLGFVTRAANR